MQIIGAEEHVSHSVSTETRI